MQRSHSPPDRTVKRSRSESKPLSDILQKQIPLDFAFQRDLFLVSPLRDWTALTQHTRRDVHADPIMPVLIEVLAAQAGPATYIEEVCRLIRRKREELQGSEGHF